MDNKDTSGKNPEATLTVVANEPRRVIYAQLHQEVFMPGGPGQLPKSMDVSPNSQQSKLRGLKMWISTLGLEIDLRGRRGVIPLANVAFAVTEMPDSATAKELDKGVATGNAGNRSNSITKLGTSTVTPTNGPIGK